MSTDGLRTAPGHIRQVAAGRYLRDVITRVPRVLLPITLAGPEPSGSAGPSRLCQGCSHPRPAPSGADCPQLHRPATTGSAVAVSHLHSNISASWRTDASIKLSAVASSLTTVSARAMLTALIGGERDPRVLAELAKGKMRNKIPALVEALTGHFDEHHAQLARGMLHRLEGIEAALAELDGVIAAACRPWAHQLQLLQTIPGVGEKVAQVIIAETGGAMSRFPSAEHLASWGGLAPGVHKSAGKRTPVSTRPGNKWLTAMLVEAAGSTGRMKETNYLSAQLARLTTRRGMGRATVAVAHSILVSAYFMLSRDQPYHDLGPDWLRRRNDEAHARRLVAQLERLGHPVILDPASCPRRLSTQTGGLRPPALTRACNSPIHGSVVNERRG